MKKFIIAPVAAVVMLSVSGAAIAQADETGVDIYKSVNVTNKMDYKGSASITGQIGVNQLGMAVIKNQQGSLNNKVDNFRNENNASVSDNSANGLAGNTGVNVASGDNNVQSNNSALTVLGKSDGQNESSESNGSSKGGYHKPTPTPVVFAKGASVDAEIGTVQTATGNIVKNNGNENNASISANSLNNSAGNLGVNTASGSGNVQANNFAVSYGQTANLAVSTVNNNQMTAGNEASNNSIMADATQGSVNVTLSGSASGSYLGNSTQSNDVYPEIWFGGNENGGHTSGRGKEYGGHIDFDNKSASGDSGRFEFADTGDITLGNVSLSGSIPTVTQTVARNNVNNASISSGSLNNAAGNVGVNVAAGTNNLQSNSLALSAANF